MPTLQVYLPQDRWRALARGVALPESTTGATLFADISGFTQLTESFTQALGPRRGAEELSRQINAVYDALIAAIEHYGGSVITFAGDAITCWFDSRSLLSLPAEPGECAVAAALALQATMAAFPALGLKVVVTSGPARRYVVGDPAQQWLDVLAGATLARLATAEHLAARGEILVDAALAAGLPIAAWRTAENGERFAVVPPSAHALLPAGASLPLTALPELIPEAAVLRPYILPAVWEREQSGLGAFLTELRPAVALFLHFTGLDYDGDAEAQRQLNDFICRAQVLVARYEGALLQLNIGDKGSYLYAVFGAPIAHEDDARRAVQAALALRQLSATLAWLPPVQIGLAQGVMRTGAYGGQTRRTYGALGEAVNLAARLMEAAAPG